VAALGHGEGPGGGCGELSQVIEWSWLATG
jgi:hypothetical protein